MKSNNTIDGWLVLQYQSGNNKALQLLVKRWHKKFCIKAFLIIKDRDIAKDIAQESWKTIMDKLYTLKDPNSFGSWALTIVYRKAIDCIKTQKKEFYKLQEYKYEQETRANHENGDNMEIKKALLKAIESLSGLHKMVINLFYVEEYSLKQISEILNISIGTTKSRLFHAREKLKRIIKINRSKN